VRAAPSFVSQYPGRSPRPAGLHRRRGFGQREQAGLVVNPIRFGHPRFHVGGEHPMEIGGGDFFQRVRASAGKAARLQCPAGPRPCWRSPDLAPCANILPSESGALTFSGWGS